MLLARRHSLRVAAGLCLAALAACGPQSLETAERVCLRDAELATAPRGSAAVGVSGGRGSVSPYANIELTISSDYIMGRDPSQVYDRCVQRRSGQAPSRPLYEQPGWRG